MLAKLGGDFLQPKGDIVTQTGAVIVKQTGFHIVTTHRQGGDIVGGDFVKLPGRAGQGATLQGRGEFVGGEHLVAI